MAPKNLKARGFAVDFIMDQLLDAKKLKVGTYIVLPEKAIRWLVKETLAIIKNEPSLLELEGPINVTGDFHG